MLCISCGRIATDPMEVVIDGDFKGVACRKLADCIGPRPGEFTAFQDVPLGTPATTREAVIQRLRHIIQTRGVRLMNGNVVDPSALPTIPVQPERFPYTTWDAIVDSWQDAWDRYDHRMECSYCQRWFGKVSHSQLRIGCIAWMTRQKGGR